MTMPSRAEIHPVLLRVLLELGGRARPREAIPKVISAFPAITAEELGEPQASGKGSKLNNRIQWARQDLVYSGHIDGSERGVWKLTALGETAAQTAAPVEQPPVIAEPEPDPYVPDPAPKPDPIAFVPNDFERTAAELIRAATDSRRPDRLEQIVGEALTLLGFETEVIGGPGATDVLAAAPLGIDRYTMVVDAKSAAGGKVPEQQINWVSLQSHRESDRADYAVVVGPDFSAGQLRGRAVDFNVCLLTADELARIVRMQAQTPVSLVELRPLFAASPLARAALEVVEAAARQRTRRMRLIERILQAIDYYNQLRPELVLAAPATLFSLMLSDPDAILHNTTLEEVQHTLNLLLALGAVRQENGAGYVSTTSLGGAQQMLNALGRLRLDNPQAEPRPAGDTAPQKPVDLSS